MARLLQLEEPPAYRCRVCRDTGYYAKMVGVWDGDGGGFQTAMCTCGCGTPFDTHLYWMRFRDDIIRRDRHNRVQNYLTSGSESA